MRGKNMGGMGRVILSKRERPIIIEPLDNGLRGMTLRYAHEVPSEAEYFSDMPEIKLPDEMLRIAAHILETKTADFDPAFLELKLIDRLGDEQTALEWLEMEKKIDPKLPVRDWALISRYSDLTFLRLAAMTTLDATQFRDAGAPHRRPWHRASFGAAQP